MYEIKKPQQRELCSVTATGYNIINPEMGPDKLERIDLQGAIPRHPAFRMPDIIVEKEWTVKESNFKSYKFDTDKLLTRCFDFDWKTTKLGRVIKDKETLARVKEVIRPYYKHIRETYKYLAALGQQGLGGVWSIG